jgi:hypothetical protein
MSYFLHKFFTRIIDCIKDIFDGCKWICSICHAVLRSVAIRHKILCCHYGKFIENGERGENQPSFHLRRLDMKKLLRTCFMRVVVSKNNCQFLYILAFGGELEDFCGSEGFVPYMFPMLFPILFSRCYLILSHTSWDACGFHKCCKFGHKFYWRGDKFIENETGEKITLHSILADLIKKCCLEIVS